MANKREGAAHTPAQTEISHTEAAHTEAAHLGVVHIEVDGLGMVTAWSDRASQILGWSEQEAMGRPITDLVVPLSSASEFLSNLTEARDLAESKSVVTPGQELLFVHRDGSSIELFGSTYVVGSGETFRSGGFFAKSSPKPSDPISSAVHPYDSLTGLPTRALFTSRLTSVLDRLCVTSISVSVLVVDLDRFRTVNDRLGHDAGDEVLCSVAARLMEAADNADTIARLGGDEFLALFTQDDSLSEATLAADRILSGLAEPFVLPPDSEAWVTASIGISSTSDPLVTPASLFSEAAVASRQAKRKGGGRYEVFGEAMRARVTERMIVEDGLPRALQRGELALFYQPVVDIMADKTVAMEALLRWFHPTEGLLRPDRFIPVAEESGLIVPIGAWALREACIQLDSWRNREAGDPVSEIVGGAAMEVNLSARQIDDPDLVRNVERILTETGVDPSSVTLEITESALMSDADSALFVLRSLEDLGLTLAIDDFGTGYSSLTYLERFPLDILKIDKSFVDGLSTEVEGSPIVGAVIDLAHDLGMTVVAEGVETEDQLTELRRLGCDHAQGYLFSRPFPAGELVGATSATPSI
jgi:diguanylate cyclase (GGDEF)-like protein